MVKGLERLAGIAFAGGVAIAHVAQEMFYSGEEIGAETAAGGIDFGEGVFF